MLCAGIRLTTTPDRPWEVFPESCPQGPLHPVILYTVITSHSHLTALHSSASHTVTLLCLVWRIENTRSLEGCVTCLKLFVLSQSLEATEMIMASLNRNVVFASIEAAHLTPRGIARGEQTVHGRNCAQTGVHVPLANRNASLMLRSCQICQQG